MIDSCAFEPKPLLTLDEALKRVLATIQPLARTEVVPLQAALGRVLMAEVDAKVDVPPHCNSAMDGYAFSSQDIIPENQFVLQCVGTSWAGRPFQGKLKLGECIRIFTGAVVPDSADSVIMQEQVLADGASILFPVQAVPKQNVRLAGEDVRFGEVLGVSPKKISAADLGLFAAAGVTHVMVLQPLKITFFSTGVELCSLGVALKAGQIYDSNRYLLQGLLDDTVYHVLDGGVIADDLESLETALLLAAQNSDVVITTGGASVGEADFVREALLRCGVVDFWKIAMKPGKPLAFGLIQGSYFFGLPGNPLAVFATFQKLVLPALSRLQGLSIPRPLRLTAICGVPLKKAPGRQEFQCGILSQADDGSFTVVSAGRQGSHILSAVSKANCFIVLPDICAGVQIGENVLVEPFHVYI